MRNYSSKTATAAKVERLCEQAVAAGVEIKDEPGRYFKAVFPDPLFVAFVRVAPFFKPVGKVPPEAAVIVQDALREANSKPVSTRGCTIQLSPEQDDPGAVKCRLVTKGLMVRIVMMENDYAADPARAVASAVGRGVRLFCGALRKAPHQRIAWAGERVEAVKAPMGGGDLGRVRLANPTPAIQP